MSPWFRWESLETGNFDGGNLHGRNRKTSLQKLPWQKEKVNASLEAGGKGRRKMGLAEESGDVEWLCSRWSDKTLWGGKKNGRREKAVYEEVDRTAKRVFLPMTFPVLRQRGSFFLLSLLHSLPGADWLQSCPLCCRGRTSVRDSATG